MSQLVPSCFILPNIATGPARNWLPPNQIPVDISKYIGIGIYNHYYAYTPEEIVNCADFSKLNPDIEFTPELERQLLDLIQK